MTSRRNLIRQARLDDAGYQRDVPSARRA